MKLETRVGLFIIIGFAIFLYLSIHIGEIRLNKKQFETYHAYFDDTGGLEAKSPVKIAGVTVGWVENIKLLAGGKAEIELRVNHIHKLGRNAWVRISQEGLIGTKTIEIDPGDSSSGYLQPGSTLAMPGRSPTTVSDLLEQFKDISSNINDVTFSMKNIFASQEGEEKMKNTIDNVSNASSNISSLAQNLDNTIDSSKDDVIVTVQNMRAVSDILKQDMPAISTSAKEALATLDDAAVQAKDMFKEADEVIEKINNGKGLVGKLINEGEMHSDIKKTIKSIKNYVQKTQNITIKIDGHSETMLDKSDSKGYGGISIYTYSDYFYMLEFLSGTVGKFHHTTTSKRYFDHLGNEIILPIPAEGLPAIANNSSDLANYAQYAQFAHTTYQMERSPSKTLVSAQVGKKFNNLTFRIGLFEDTFGVAVDYNMPTGSNYFKWITSLEAFDFYGHNRSNGDQRAHVKWINRIFFVRNLYSVFGLDDMVAHTTTKPFWGFGLRFDDDDLKYVLSSILPAMKS